MKSFTTTNTSYKTAKTIKEYSGKFYNWDIAIPIGSIVTNKTACGNYDSYHFWQDFHKIAEQITGYKNSILEHDLTYYGVNIPAEYCEPYKI
jgi:hypothetical protein